MGRRRDQAQLARDRRRISDLYLQGWLQADIADEIGINQSTVSRDIKALQQGWLDSALINFDKAKAQELAKIDRLEREYWRAWVLSCEVKESTLAEKAETTGGSREKTQLRREGRSGNHTYLKGVEWCIEQRCKITGIYAPDKKIHVLLQRELEDVFNKLEKVLAPDDYHRALDALSGEPDSEATP